MVSRTYAGRGPRAAGVDRRTVVMTGNPAQTQVTQVSVQRMRPEDWEVARCVRLAALADAPAAFGSTLDDEVALPDAVWRERALANAAGETRIGVLAFCNALPCGIAVGLLAPTGEAELHGMWVAQNVRRRGAGRALTQAVCAWARERGAQRISLEVVSSNHGAIGLYRANGFELLQDAQTTCGTRRAPALRLGKRL